MTWEFFLALTLVSAGFIMCIAMVVLRFTLDRRVRKALPRDKVYDNYPDWYFGVGRAISFGSAALFERVKKSDYMQRYYDGFDVKTFANPFEKLVSWIMVISLVMILLIGVIVLTLDFFGMHPWK